MSAGAGVSGLGVGVLTGAVGVGLGGCCVSVGSGDTGETGDWCLANTLVADGESKSASPVATRAMTNNFNPRWVREARGILFQKGNRLLPLSKVIKTLLFAGPNPLERAQNAQTKSYYTKTRHN